MRLIRFSTLILSVAYILFVSSLNYTHTRFHQQNRLVTSSSQDDVLFDRFIRYQSHHQEELVQEWDNSLMLACPFALLMNNLVSSLYIFSIPSVHLHLVYILKEVLGNTPFLTPLYSFFSRAPPQSF